MSAPLLQPARDAAVFAGGLHSAVPLDHPEGLCVDPLDGSLWCGGEGGQLYHVSADGKSVRQVACTGGFILGVALDLRGRLYLCDLRQHAVIVMDRAGRELQRLTARDGEWALQVPNATAFSADERFLYVSDTRPNGPGVWRFDLATGVGELWMSENCRLANGLALAPEGDALFLVESRLPGIARIPIRVDGSAGPQEIVLPLPGNEPDGLAFDARGRLWISVFHPSRLYRWDRATRRLDLIIEDDTTDWLHHPTNLAFRGERELFTANLGAWHLTRVDLTFLSS